MAAQWLRSLHRAVRTATCQASLWSAEFYRWTLLLAPDDKPETHGRQYLIREISPKIDPRDGSGSSKGLRIPGRGFEEPGLEQQRRHVRKVPRIHPVRRYRPWEFEIQDVCMQSSGEARVRMQLPRVPDVESFEALIKDAFLKSDGTRKVDRNPVMWMGVAWTALAEAGYVLGVGGLKSEPVGWETVQKTVMEFVTAQERRGRLDERNLTLRVPTWGPVERQLLVS